MACKLLCVTLAVFCAAQVLATPHVTRVQHNDPSRVQKHLKPSQRRGLIADINAAIEAINVLQESIDTLKGQITKSLVVVTVDTARQIKDILNQLRDLGISAAEIDAAEAAINQSLANVEGVFTGIVDDLNAIGDLLGLILTDLGNIDLLDLAAHIIDLDTAFKKIQNDVSTVYSRVSAEFANIFKTIIDLTIGEPVEIVQQITEAVLNIGDTWRSEATKLWNSFSAMVDAAAAALDALQAIVTKSKILLR